MRNSTWQFLVAAMSVVSAAITLSDHDYIWGAIGWAVFGAYAFLIGLCFRQGTRLTDDDGD